MKPAENPWGKRARSGPNPDKERRIYGVHACAALYENRPEVLTRVYATAETAPQFKSLQAYCKRNERLFKTVEPAELNTIAKTRHHEGICLFVIPGPAAHHAGYLAALPAEKSDCVLALEAVSNPHNLGAILRTAAHFGVQAVLVEDPAMVQNGAVARTAEGGLEQVNLLGTPDLVQALEDFKAAGFTIATSSSRAGKAVFDAKLPHRLLYLLGAEGRGLSPEVLSKGDLDLSIPGTGSVESLNVSTAAGILLAEYWRQHATPLP